MTRPRRPSYTDPVKESGSPAAAAAAIQVDREPAREPAADLEHEVLTRWRRGEREAAFRLVMTAHGARVLAFALRITRDAAVARDVRQQTFLEVWRGLDGFDGRARLSTWLYSIAHNRSIDATRRRDRIGASEQPTDFHVLESSAVTSDPVMDAARIDQYRALERCLQRVAAPIRAQLLMRYVEGMTHAEIAAIVGDAPGTVQVRLGRALPKLRRCLRAQGAGR